jgi:hypothetical protein
MSERYKIVKGRGSSEVLEVGQEWYKCRAITANI